METSLGRSILPNSPVPLADHYYPDLLVLGHATAYLVEVRNLFYYYLRKHTGKFYMQDDRWLTGFLDSNGRHNYGVFGKNWTGPEFPIRGTSRSVYDAQLKKTVRRMDTITVPPDKPIVPVYVSTVKSFYPGTETLFDRWLAEKHGHEVWAEHPMITGTKHTDDDDLECQEQVIDRLEKAFRRILTS